MRQDQFLALARAHYSGDNKQFSAVVQQVAAHSKSPQVRRELESLSTRLIELPRDVRGLVTPLPPVGLGDLVLDPRVRDSLRELAQEQTRALELAARGLQPRRRLLFTGDPGNGKSAAASVIAGLIGKNGYVVSLPALIDGFLGGTGRNLGKVFTFLGQGDVVVLDEIDAIGSSRSGDGGAGSREYNTIVATLLTEIDHCSGGILVCTTNRPDILDPALKRRFDSTVHFDGPSPEQARSLAHRLCEKFGVMPWPGELPATSFADVETLVRNYARREILRELPGENQ